MIFPHAAVITAQNIVRRNNEKYEKKKKDKEMRDYSKQPEKEKK